jgi:hypothetical protein
MLFDFVRAAFAGPQTACTDLSRRLRDGVSLEKEVAFSATGTCCVKSASVVNSPVPRLAAEKRAHYQRFRARLTL